MQYLKLNTIFFDIFHYCLFHNNIPYVVHYPEIYSGFYSLLNDFQQQLPTTDFLLPTNSDSWFFGN